MVSKISRKSFLRIFISSIAYIFSFKYFNLFNKAYAALKTDLNSRTVVHVQGKNIKKSTINKMVSLGFKQIGGIEKYIKKGMNVVIKPNIGFNSAPRRAHNSNPYLVEAVAKLCVKAGAQVTIFDRSTTNARLCYKNSGIEQAAKNAGAETVIMNSRRFKPVKVKNGLNLSTIDVFDQMMKADFVINIPIAKDHASATLTLAMKNLMGVLGGFRGKYHLSLHQNIVDFNKAIPVHLVIMDATRILTDNGPGSGTQADVKERRSIIFSTNAVTVDAYTSQTFFNIKPSSIDYLKYAAAEKMGEINYKKIRAIKRYV